MDHRTHTYLMVGLSVLAGVLLLSGAAGGSAFTFVWLAGCAAMMFFMMRGTGGMDHGGRRDDDARDEVEHEH